MNPTIQTLAQRHRQLTARYGADDPAALDAARELSNAVLSDRKIIDVDPGTLVCYAQIGIAVNCNYNPDMASRQPFVTVNTEELDVDHRYGANANLLMWRRELIEAGGSADRIKELNAEIDRQAGSPAIAVHLNDAVLYDDIGHGSGNQAPVVGTPTVYVVNPNFPDDTAAVFADFDDAKAYAATFDHDPHVEEQSVADSRLANVMISDRMEEDDPTQGAEVGQDWATNDPIREDDTSDLDPGDPQDAAELTRRARDAEGNA